MDLLGAGLSLATSLLSGIFGGGSAQSSPATQSSASEPAYEDLVRSLVQDYILPALQEPIGTVGMQGDANMSGLSIPVYDKSLSLLAPYISSLAGPQRSQSQATGAETGWLASVIGSDSTQDAIGTLIDGIIGGDNNDSTPDATVTVPTNPVDVGGGGSGDVGVSSAMALPSGTVIQSPMLKAAFKALRQNAPEPKTSYTTGNEKINKGNTPGLSLY